MLFESLSQNVTEPVIIFEAANFGDNTESFKGFVVEFVDERKVRVRDNDVW